MNDLEILTGFEIFMGLICLEFVALITYRAIITELYYTLFFTVPILAYGILCYYGVKNNLLLMDKKDEVQKE